MSGPCEDCGYMDDAFLNEDGVVYHFTCPTRVNSILQQGLLPGSAPVINKEKRGPLYFLSPGSPSKLWMDIMCELWVHCKTRPILLQINNLNRSYHIRRVFRQDKRGNLTPTAELHTHHNIAPMDIEVVNDLPWSLGNIDGPNHEYCKYLNELTRIDGKWVRESGPKPWLVDGSLQYPPPTALPLDFSFSTNYEEENQGEVQLALEYKSQFPGLEDQTMADEDDFYPSRDVFMLCGSGDDETQLDAEEDDDDACCCCCCTLGENMIYS